jgi:hypothetical protein
MLLVGRGFSVLASAATTVSALVSASFTASASLLGKIERTGSSRVDQNWILCRPAKTDRSPKLLNLVPLVHELVSYGTGVDG